MPYSVVSWDGMRDLAGELSKQIEELYPETGRAYPLKSTIGWLGDCVAERVNVRRRISQ